MLYWRRNTIVLRVVYSTHVLLAQKYALQSCTWVQYLGICTGTRNTITNRGRPVTQLYGSSNYWSITGAVPVQMLHAGYYTMLTLDATVHCTRLPYDTRRKLFRRMKDRRMVFLTSYLWDVCNHYWPLRWFISTCAHHFLKVSTMMVGFVSVDGDEFFLRYRRDSTIYTA